MDILYCHHRHQIWVITGELDAIRTVGSHHKSQAESFHLNCLLKKMIVFFEIWDTKHNIVITSVDLHFLTPLLIIILRDHKIVINHFYFTSISDSQLHSYQSSSNHSLSVSGSSDLTGCYLWRATTERVIRGCCCWGPLVEATKWWAWVYYRNL